MDSRCLLMKRKYEEMRKNTYPKKLERIKNSSPLHATKERNACSGERLKKAFGSTNSIRRFTAKISGPTVENMAEMNAL